MVSAKEKAQKFIDDNPVAVFSKSWCPYCRATKDLLDQLGAKYAVMELDKLDNNEGDAIQDALNAEHKQRSVPNIFISKQHIGGNSDIQAKKSQLPAMLKSAGAL